MANWSSDTFYVDLKQVDNTDFINLIQFDPQTKDGAYWALNSIKFFGRMCIIQGDGRWGTGANLSSATMELFKRGMWDHQFFDGFEPDTHLRVMSGETIIYDHAVDGIDPDTDFPREKGTTPEEIGFFHAMWYVIDREVEKRRREWAFERFLPKELQEKALHDAYMNHKLSFQEHMEWIENQEEAAKLEALE